MSRFNLIDEKWIPVCYHDGSRDELGIRSTLLSAKKIVGIEDPSPLVVAALHRFLLAVLYRALEGPTDIDQAKAWFKSGWQEEKIAAYLEKWRSRFWLFDEYYPFGQIQAFEPQAWRAWTALAAEHNADNAKVLFDHIDVLAAGTIPSSLAARWLITSQTFSLGGGKSDFAYTKGAPSAGGVMAIPLGGHLQETLLFCLVPQNRKVMKNDLPVWEREPMLKEELKKGPSKLAMGWADLYTWPTRSIKLRFDGDDKHISHLAFASGVENVSKDGIDPMLAYRVDEKRGKLPIQFRERGLWRDFDSLLPDKALLAPRVIEHAATLTRFNRKRFPGSVLVLGQANNKAKIAYWRMERFAMPEVLASDRSIRTEIRQLLMDAEEAQKALWLACRSYARDLLSRGDRVPDKKDIREFVGQMSAIPWYWSTLESCFHEILREYRLDSDPDDIRHLWLKAVRSALNQAWKQHSDLVSTGDAWAIRALVKSEEQVNRKLENLTTEILKLESQEETA